MYTAQLDLVWWAPQHHPSICLSIRVVHLGSSPASLAKAPLATLDACPVHGAAAASTPQPAVPSSAAAELFCDSVLFALARAFDKEASHCSAGRHNARFDVPPTNGHCSLFPAGLAGTVFTGRTKRAVQ